MNDIADQPGRNHFFARLAWLLFAITLVGFGRTFFLRPFFDVPPIPWYVHLHGAILTAWFALLCAQTSLIASHRTDQHRRLGQAGAFLAAALVVVGLYTTLAFRARARLDNVPADISLQTGYDPDITTNIVWGDLCTLALFAGLIAAALLLRRNAGAHSRLMLLASMNLAGPAIARALGIGAQLTGWPPAVHISLLLLALVGLPSTLIVHDLRSTRRIHRATLAGIALTLLSAVAAQVAAHSPVGRAFVVDAR
jgi:hypothetical protein